MRFSCDNYRHSKKQIVLLLLCFFCFQVEQAFSAEAFIGVSTSWGLMKGEEKTTGYDISEPHSNEELELVLSVKSFDNYFENTSFGYFIELGLGTYTVDKATGNYSTSQANGEYWYLTPTLFYDFAKAGNNDWSLKVGLGLGAGYLTIDGSIIMDAPGVPSRSVDGYNYNVSVGIFLAYEYKNWVVQFKEYTPSASIEGIDFIVELPTFMIGYRFRL